jgi:hypothetical protein
MLVIIEADVFIYVVKLLRSRIIFLEGKANMPP